MIGWGPEAIVGPVPASPSSPRTPQASMATSKAATVAEYLAELPPERRAEVARVRDVIRKRLPKGYAESMAFGMIGYGIPLERYPNTYNGQPLSYVALAAQKHYYALYLMPAYGHEPTEVKLRKAFEDAGKKLDMGKSCIRFKTADDLPLDAIGDIIASFPAEKWIEIYEASRRR